MAFCGHSTKFTSGILTTIYAILKSRLPQPLHRKAIEQRLVRNQHHALGLRLRDQQAVERVLVGDGHLTREAGVAGADRQFGEALRGHDRFEILRQQRRSRQLATSRCTALPRACRSFGP